MTKVLILDHSKSMRNNLRERLEFEGYSTEGAADEAAAAEMCGRIPFDLILSGDMCRPPKNDIPFIVLSSEGSIDSAVEALRNGARDYLTKPIRMKLLVSRVQAILKRIDTTPAARIALDRTRHAVCREGQCIALPRKEFELLDLLCSEPGRLFTREEIYRRVWGSGVVVGDRTIDVHIRKLRQKIGEERIVTIKGVGYRYEE